MNVTQQRTTRTNGFLAFLIVFGAALGLLGPGALGANQNVQRTEVTLTPSLFAPTNAIADATFTLRRHRFDFEVNAEDLQPGVYNVYVGGQLLVQMLMTSVPGGSEGKVELSSHPLTGQLTLFADPRGKDIDIAIGSTILFSGKLAAQGNPEGPDDGATFNNVNEKIDLDVLDGSRAKGKLQLKSNKRQAQLQFNFQHLDEGSYTITANAIAIADFTTNKKGKAKVRFRTLPTPKDLLLDFDPVNTTFRVVRGNTAVVLQGTTDAQSIGGGASPIGTLEQTFNNPGAYPGASGDAIFRDLGTTLEFDVSVANLPVGSYDLVVDGMTVGGIGVASGTEGTTGLVRFSTEPGSPSVNLLDFDPRGQTVQVLEGETVVLSMSFPSGG